LSGIFVFAIDSIIAKVIEKIKEEIVENYGTDFQHVSVNISEPNLKVLKPFFNP
jgi:hypothetical protein